MKQVFFLRLFFTVFISVAFSNKIVLADCNTLSYWQTSSGQCIDLTALSNLTAIQKELNKPPVFSNNNLEVTNLRLIKSEIGTTVRGTVTNKSNTSLKVDFIDYQLVNSSGVPIYNGTFVVSTIISPNKIIAISNFIGLNALQRYKPSTLKIEVLRSW